MNSKNLWVSFLAVASLLLLVATVSAVPTISGDLADNLDLKVDGTSIGSFNGGVFTSSGYDVPAVVAGDNVAVKVTFVASESDTDVTLEAELEGSKVKTNELSPVFDVEAGKTYSKTVVVKVPFELRDAVSDDLELTITLDGKDYETEIENIELRVQRPSYNPSVKSITVDQTIRAGETFPVDIVLKNMGYNELEDLYITVGVPSLGLQKSAYFGDLVPIENCSDDCDEEDTVSGRLYLTVPYNVKPGTYALEVKVLSDDMTVNDDDCTVTTSDGSVTITKQIVISNDFVDNVIVSSTSATVSAGQSAVYNILIVNPTDQVQVYKLVPASSSGVTSGVSDTIVAVPAGSSKTVQVTANAANAGEYAFSVAVFQNDQLAKTIAFSLKSEQGSSAMDPVVILTIVLAIVFLVLLIVLIVLIAKKPQKSEEFGESYY